MLALMCTRIKSNLSDHRSRRGAPSASPHPADTALEAIVSIQNFILIKRGMLRIRVRTSHKNIANGFGAGKRSACILTQVGVRSSHTSTRAEVSVRKWSCQAGRQQTVFTGMTRHELFDRESLLYWADLPVTGFYTYPEHTP